MKTRNQLVIASVCALAAWMPPAYAQELSRHDTRSGLIEFEANGYPTDTTVRRIEQEIDYQRAVQAYIHYLPAVSFMQWRNGHFGPLGGKAGDMIIYRTTEQKLPILTPNDTTTYIATWAELSDFGGLLMYEVPAGPTGGLINDLWQRVVADTGMVGPDRGKGGKFLIVLEGTEVPENHGADFVVTSKTNTVLVGTRILTPDPKEEERILNAHKIHGLGQESRIRIFEAPNRNWWNYQPRGMEYWKVVHQAIQLNPVEERDMAVLQGLKNLGIEKGKPFNPTTPQKKILEEATLVGETWAMGNSFLKRDPVKHWVDDPKSKWEFILFMQSPLDQMAKTHMEIDTRTAYTYEAVTMSAAATMNLVDAGIQYLASYKDDAGRWLDGARTYELVVPANVPMLNFWSVVLYDNDTRGMIINPQGKTEVNSRQASDLLGATKMDRPEWIAIDQGARTLYCTLTNNTRRGMPNRPAVDAANPRANNTMGHIIQWPEDEDFDTTTFSWKHLLLAGDPANERPEARGNIGGDSFACPDGLTLDARGVLWIQTDVTSDEKGRGEFQGFGNNKMLAGDPATGEVRRFLTGPVGCEITGLTLTPDGRTMFVNIQHPGEPLTPRDDNLEVPNLHNDPTDPRRYSNWPDFRPDVSRHRPPAPARRASGFLSTTTCGSIVNDRGKS